MKNQVWKNSCRLVNFFAADGLELQGAYFRGKRKNKTAALHIPGLGSKFHKEFGKYLSDAYAKNDIDLFIINTRGSGEVDHFKKYKSTKYSYVLAGGGAEKFEDCVKDIKGALSFLRSQGYKKIVLQGHSTGCQKTTYFLNKAADKTVKALILFAPADDYNVNKKELGKNFSKAVKLAEEMIRQKKGNEFLPRKLVRTLVTASRFYSYCSTKKPEANIFNYNANKLTYFNRIKLPTLALFGSEEQVQLKPVKEYMQILERNSGAKPFSWKVIKGGDHGFAPKQKQAANHAAKWISSIIK